VFYHEDNITNRRWGGAIKGTVVNISRDLINIVKEIVLLNFENFL
jgi:hypothetical protein